MRKMGISQGPYPEPLRGLEVGTFTHDSIVRRLPEIGRRTLAENEFSPEIIRELETLLREIPEGAIRPLDDPQAPDVEAWEAYAGPYLGLNWLEAPWFFVEFYYYRRVLQATGYFRVEADGFGVDPYRLQKRRGLREAQKSLRALSARVNRWISEDVRGQEAITEILTVDLWGNQADLSLWPVGEEGAVERGASDQEGGKILIDDSDRVADLLTGLDSGLPRVDIILDNAGLELVTDLTLADFLLGTDLVQWICLHPKAYPIFVSDAMVSDLMETVETLASGPTPEVRAVGNRLKGYLQEGRLTLCGELFWTSPQAMWEMPGPLKADFEASNLVIFKGDANYRRLLGDRHWPFTTPFGEIMSYFPSPMLALRTNKSEVICGLEPGRTEELAQQDPNWLTNGERGVIQFYAGG
jgi:hypothetical protein